MLRAECSALRVVAPPPRDGSLPHTGQTPLGDSRRKNDISSFVGNV
jgi:hypothetical protein